MTAARQFAEALFDAAVRAADPYAATRSALEGRALGARPWILAVGKAAVPMARAALDTLAAARRIPAGGVVIAAEVPADAAADVTPLAAIAGDHPLPGPQSLAAADALGAAVRLVRPGDDVLVLVSGGASSLMAAPVEGISAEAMLDLFRGLHHAGAPIDVMNAFRKRVMRWSAGRLAVALGDAAITVLIASDVIGDDPSAIASGPCSGDRWRATDLIELAHKLRLGPYLPDEVQSYLDRTLSGEVAETPKPGNPALLAVEMRVILGNRHALDGVVRAGARVALPVRVAPTPITGRARSIGAAIANAAIATRGAPHLPARRPLNVPCRVAMVWGGETTVPLPAGVHGTGGRAQELALAAAQALYERGAEGRGITILSAGTDGRDGPTDAAGAVVDANTWTRIALAGRNPLRDLEGHDAYPALDAAGALLRTGMTGTNVNDVVIALVD